MDITYKKENLLVFLAIILIFLTVRYSILDIVSRVSQNLGSIPINLIT